MTTIEVLVPAVADDIDANDPFRYGWRPVQSELENGQIVVDQVPLTLEDVLYPEEGDHVTHSDAHQRRMRYLCDVFEAQLAHDETAVVLNDVRIKWDVPELRPHGPDIMVISGVQARQNWSTFDVATEGVRPALIIEITSPETRMLDLTFKLDQYDIAGVPLYVIVDTVTARKPTTLRLLGYRQTPDGYQVLPPDERGWLWLEPVQVWLGVREDEIYCFDEHGTQLLDYTAVVAALEAEAEARTAAERRAAEEAEARTAAEARAAEEAARATAEEAARTAAEARAAEEAEARVAEAEARTAAERRATAEEAARTAAEHRTAEIERRLQAMEAELRRLRED